MVARVAVSPQGNLKTLFSPHEHKALISPGTEAAVLRSVAEALAFERLERQEIGATEREVREVAARVGADAGSPETLLERLLTHGVLRRQSAIWLQFPYPIVQEYLAACYLVREQPETLARRVDDALQRPWAQVVQFALELYSAPTPIVRAMLDREDDAFATALRLVARCVSNRARVEAEVRDEIARRLARFWVYAPYRTRERVGRLLVDGFSNPLIPEVRSVLGCRWLIDNGAGEIVTRANDPALTMEVLSALLGRGLERYMAVRTLQPALDRLGDDAFNRYAEKAREPSVTADQLHGLAHLIGALDYRCLSPGLGLKVALDEALPDDIRLEAFCVASRPLDDRARPIIRRAVASDYSWAAMKAVSYTQDPGAVVLSLLHDVSIPEERRRLLAGSLRTLFPDLERKLAFVRRCAADLSSSAALERHDAHICRALWRPRSL